MSFLNFGKYKDKHIREIPDDYLNWIKDNNVKLIEQIDKELTRRESDAEANMPLKEKIISMGYKALAKQFHPDLGGDLDKMKNLNLAVEDLKEMIR